MIEYKQMPEMFELTLKTLEMHTIPVIGAGVLSV